MMTVQSGILTQEGKRQNFRPSYFVLQGIFYFLQGFFLTGSTVYVGVTMANWGLPLVVQTATQATIAIPAYFKMLTALLSDRVPIRNWGRRKPYMVLGTILFAPSFIFMLSIKEFSSMWVFSLAVVFMAWVIVDGTLDAITVDITPEEKHGTMQGVANGSKMAGLAVGAIVVPFLGPKIGWSTTVTIIAVCAMLQGISALFYSLPIVTRQDLSGELPVGTVFKKAFGSAIPWIGILFNISIAAMGAFSSVSSSYILTNLEWAKSPQLLNYYGYSKLIHYLGAVIAAVIIGKLVSKFRNSMTFYSVSLLGLWIFVLPWLLVPSTGNNVMWVIAAQFFAGCAYGIITVLGTSVAMQICEPGIEGFMFALLMSCANLGEAALGANMITRLAELVGGVVPAFFTLVPFSFICFICLKIIFKTLARRKSQITELAFTAG